MSEHRFDPAVVALLDEVARSSSSGLLRVPKERLLRWVGREEEVVTPHGTWLSRAERHLVAAYREQAAFVLLDACVVRLVGRADSGVFVESERLPDAARLAERAHRAVQSAGSLDHRSFEPLSTLERLDPSQLAAASLRLVPSDAGRIALGASQHSEGHLRAALRTFGAILQGRPAALIRSVAHDNLGSLWCTQRDFPRALACYVEANGACEGRWKTTISRIVVSMQVDDEEEAWSAANLLAEMQPNPVACDELAGFLAKTRRESRWSLTAPAMRLLPRLRDQMTGEARKVCDALLPIEG